MDTCFTALRGDSPRITGQRGFEPRSTCPKPAALSRLCYRPLHRSLRSLLHEAAHIACDDIAELLGVDDDDLGQDSLVLLDISRELVAKLHNQFLAHALDERSLDSSHCRQGVPGPF